jgi:hypothetical protein
VPIAEPVGPAYDVTGDGQKFVVVAKPPDSTRVLHIVSNWRALLEK